VNTIAD